MSTKPERTKGEPVLWKAYYHDGSTYCPADAPDGVEPTEDAPNYGIILIMEQEQNGLWMGGDLQGVLGRLRNGLKVRALKEGIYLTRAEFRRICDIANADPDFPEHAPKWQSHDYYYRTD